MNTYPKIKELATKTARALDRLVFEELPNQNSNIHGIREKIQNRVDLGIVVLGSIAVVGLVSFIAYEYHASYHVGDIVKPGKLLMNVYVIGDTTGIPDPFEGLSPSYSVYMRSKDGDGNLIYAKVRDGTGPDKKKPYLISVGTYP